MKKIGVIGGGAWGTGLAMVGRRAGLEVTLWALEPEVAEAVNQSPRQCVAVDIPSGVHGDTGEVLGGAFNACVTVTFFRPKPGHLLLPGRSLSGEVAVADIGIPDSVLAGVNPRTFVNGPCLWLRSFPRLEIDSHKYSRGHAVVAGGPEMTGAARLASTAARRAGAGLVTIAAPPEAVPVYAAGAPGTLYASAAGQEAFAQLLSDPRKNAVLVGPGCGVTETTRHFVLAALQAEKSCVLDADALTVFSQDPKAMFSEINAPTVLTPHEGEFARLFAPPLFGVEGDKLSRARAAAGQSGAVVLLKGADTVIASPEGKAVINDNAPPELATAGTGDVLAGFILGLLAQGMDAFDAACAGAWLHGAAAARYGPGLIAEDISETLPGVLRSLKEKQ